MMNRRESKKVELALAVLRRQFEDRFSKPDRGPALQLALRVLLPYVGPHELISFWNIAENPNTLQRLNNLEKTYRGIEARVRTHHAYAAG